MASPDRAATAGYARVAARLEADECVVLDGGVGTEVRDDGGRPGRPDEASWGSLALIERPEAVLDVHRAYVAAGSDVITTNTWGLSSLTNGSLRPRDSSGPPVHWLDVARQGLVVAGEAAADRGRAVAFSLNAGIDSPDGAETIQLLARLFAERQPDLVLVETLSVLRPSLLDTVRSLVDLGLPVWLSFRRCRHGLCGVYGQHWGGPEGDEFGRAARRFEEMGVAAMLVNCIPPDHVDGMVSYLRDFTDLPLGVYPNLGYFTDRGWRFEPGVGGKEFAEMALRWRSEGAQIVGGCCGTGPAHIAAAREALETVPAGRARPSVASGNGNGHHAGAPAASDWRDRHGRALYPLTFPDVVVEPGVETPGDATLLAWRHLASEGVGAGQRCLDVGCGPGLLSVQLALNGAAHVHAIDVDGNAVANTLTNAFRNEVASRVTATTVDLYPWVPQERYDVIVANLPQLPVDPLEVASSHRIADYWGRNLVDQLIGKLPDALDEDGVAYVVQLSTLSRARTTELLDAAGYEVRVTDHSLFGFDADHEARRAQVERVEELSDAYHLRLGARDLLVGYLLEIRRAR